MAADFCSARSSCALCVSTFGPWRLNPRGLLLDGVTGFDSLRFEAKVPILDDDRRTPPNLDVLASAPGAVVAVEAKLIEYLYPRKPASVSAAYDDVIAAASPSWQRRIELLCAAPTMYQLFNAAQIVKHYLGLTASPMTRSRSAHSATQSCGAAGARAATRRSDATRRSSRPDI